MDKCTHDVRRANWLNIINQCQERPANVTVHQWLKDNDIKEKSYYYWLRKFRKESYDQMKLPVTTENPAEISFVEIAAPVTSEKTIQTREFSSASNATAVVRNGDIILEISNGCFRCCAKQAPKGGSTCWRTLLKSIGLCLRVVQWIYAKALMVSR